MNESRTISTEDTTKAKFEPNKQNSRRNFLQKIFNLAVLGAASQLMRSGNPPNGEATQGSGVVDQNPLPHFQKPPEVKKSLELERMPQMLQIDIFDLGAFVDPMVQDLLKEAQVETVEELFESMGVDDFSTDEGRCNAVPRTPAQAKLLLLETMLDRYKDHGDLVNKAREEAVKTLHGPDAILPIPQASILPAIRVSDVHYDNIGNPWLDFEIDHTMIEAMVADSDSDVVSMSFEMGKIPIAYSLNTEIIDISAELNKPNRSIVTGADGRDRYYLGSVEVTKEEFGKTEEPKKTVVLKKPIDRKFGFVDGYAGENTFTNVSYMVELANKFPEKVFVVASGNPSNLEGIKLPDITEAKKRLEQQGLWPENLILVGVEGAESGYVGPFSLGADVYVNHKDMYGFARASSFATPIVAEVVRKLLATGRVSIADLKQELLKLTDTIEGSPSYSVLNIDKVINFQP